MIRVLSLIMTITSHYHYHATLMRRKTQLRKDSVSIRSREIGFSTDAGNKVIRFGATRG